jgi:hypothetical protein
LSFQSRDNEEKSIEAFESCAKDLDLDEDLVKDVRNMINLTSSGHYTEVKRNMINLTSSGHYTEVKRSRAEELVVLVCLAKFFNWLYVESSHQ